MKGEKITISDIADALKVSAISVSRALSGQPGVSSELRDRILSKAREMGYARSRSSAGLNILMLNQKPYIQDNSNFSYMVQGIEKAVQDAGAGLDTEFVDKDSQYNKKLPCKLLRGNNYDGIIFIGNFSQEYAEFLKKNIKNQVFYAGYSPSYDCDSIWFNFNNSGFKQCEYLIKKGHKNIGFIGGNNTYKNSEKILGITTALDKYGLSADKDLFLSGHDSWEKEIVSVISIKHPTAFICQCDFTAIKLIKLLYEKGFKIPDDISIMGSGNSEMSELSIPSLSTLDFNIEYSCREAVELLLKRINNPDKPFESIAVNSILIERDSVKNLLTGGQRLGAKTNKGFYQEA